MFHFYFWFNHCIFLISNFHYTYLSIRYFSCFHFCKEPYAASFTWESSTTSSSSSSSSNTSSTGNERLVGSTCLLWCSPAYSRSSLAQSQTPPSQKRAEGKMPRRWQIPKPWHTWFQRWPRTTADLWGVHNIIFKNNNNNNNLSHISLHLWLLYSHLWDRNTANKMTWL